MNKKDIKNFALKLIRKADSHKYDYGHALIVAGSRYMPGAGVLCCNAAMRAGAGLVTYAVKENFLNNACSLSKPETMFFVYENASDILGFIAKRKVSSVVIGPGLQADKNLKKFIEKIIFSVEIPVILDAGGISVFNGKCGIFKKSKAKLIITPHIGEFSKLTNKKPDEIKKDKAAVSADFAAGNSVICILKGHNTIVADGKNIYINDSGAPAMAKAGSGDVLSGILAAFVCIGGDLFESSKFAVYVHGLSGEMSEKEKGNSGVIASDIVENIPFIMRRLQ
ncbi:MAG: NAD(P)H-hydrate dehydratase [Endomicrobium sp.]|jgi:NAD(P)H-hydrate epimerase|nr:NAD(P)H-hydrate dehydratase [Endomicrobium sp.]